MEALENKTYWTIAELGAYCGQKNHAATRRWMRKVGLGATAGMVNKKEFFICLARTANVRPMASLYRCITKTKKGESYEPNQTHLRNPQADLRPELVDAGHSPAPLSGGAGQRGLDAGGMGRASWGVALKGQSGCSGLDRAAELSVVR